MHPSIRALLDAFAPERDAKAIIRRLAREKISKARTMGWNGPPYCPKELASIVGIRVKQVDHDIGGDGRILPYPDGTLWIEYRSASMMERQRFTIFHELAHTLFPDFCNAVSEVVDEKQERQFEGLCDVAASEMLLPYDDIVRDLKHATAFGMKFLQDQANRYAASIDATIRRFVDLNSNVPVGAVFLTDQKGEFSGRGPLWVQYMCKNSTCRTYIRPGCIPPWNSVAVNCLKRNLGITPTAKETWWIDDKPRSSLVQAARLPSIPGSPTYPKVVALLLPTGYHNAV
jgi:hypothetical protein